MLIGVRIILASLLHSRDNISLDPSVPGLCNAVSPTLSLTIICDLVFTFSVGIMKFINFAVYFKYNYERPTTIYLSRTSRAETKIGTDLLRVEVLVHDALDDAGSVVVEKPGAGLTEARYELVQGLGKEIKSCGEQTWSQAFFYQADLVEKIHDFLFSGIGRDEFVLNY